jgi:hypothetical protein
MEFLAIRILSIIDGDGTLDVGSTITNKIYTKLNAEKKGFFLNIKNM